MIFYFVPFPVLIVFSVSTLLLVIKTTAYEAFEDSAHHSATKMLRSLKGTKDFGPVHDQQTSQKMEIFLSSNNKQERHLESNQLLTQKFLTKSELQNAVNVYCNDPNGWINSGGYATYGPIKDWDVSEIKDMRYLFGQKNTCNPNISSWDVSGVENFIEMFRDAEAFNQDLSSWNVSSGTTFVYMFYGAATFNQDLSSWDVSSGTSFAGMFRGANVFNQDLSSWDVSKGTTFSEMFAVTAFNQDLSSWDVSKGTNFIYMFYNAASFNQDLSSWDVSSGTSFNYMFYGATSFFQNLCKWDISPTAAKSEFCTGGSYCGGDCSLCNVVDVFAQTLFLPGAGACWRVQLAAGGTLEGDFTDASCSKTESEWQSTDGVFSIFASISVLDETAVFIPGTNGFSGTFQFVEDPTVTQASLQMLSWDPTAKVFAIEVTIPTCSADAVCPTMKIEL